MPKTVFIHVTSVVTLLFMVGCSSVTSGVKVRSYAQDKPRVDQEFEGNQGYFLGGPTEDTVLQRRLTRRVYVLEVSKEADEVVTKISQDEGNNSPAVTPVALKIPAKKKHRVVVREEAPIPLPDFLNDDMLMEENVMEQKTTSSRQDDFVATSFVEYKVTKDDTLQKISKKFYDAYSKWPRIYEANKKLIKSPDQIKPGTVLRIPVE